MINCNFAPNERWDDAWLSFRLLFTPWKWLHGKDIKAASQKLSESFFPLYKTKLNFNFFLTGRSALYHLLHSLNLPAKSEVIVQAFTCEAVILPILANNLTPVYIDIESQSFSMNPIELEKKITANTKAIILQYTFGITPTHIAKIKAISTKYKLMLIEDIAHGYNASSQIKKNSKCIFVMSFGRSKALSSVFGGAIATSDQNLHNKLKSEIGKLKQPSRLFILRVLLYKPIAYVCKQTFDLVIGKIIHKLFFGTKILIPEITDKEKEGLYDLQLDKAYPNALAILLMHQIKKFKQMHKQRAKICQLYAKAINNNQFTISLPSRQAGNLSLLRFPLMTDNRQAIIRKGLQNHIYFGNWYTQTVAPKSLKLDKVGYKQGICPVAESFCARIINLPTYITKQEALKIMDNIAV